VKARVIDRYTRVRATAAAFTDEPHLSTGYPMQLLARLSGARGTGESHRIPFVADTDEPVVYYAAAAARHRLDLFFKTSRIEARYKAARWHLLTAARHLVLSDSAPPFGDRQFRTWASPLLDALWSDTAGPALFLEAAAAVDAAGMDLSRRALRNASATQDLLQTVRGARTERAASAPTPAEPASELRSWLRHDELVEAQYLSVVVAVIQNSG
jgi:hypothetical protein